MRLSSAASLVMKRHSADIIGLALEEDIGAGDITTDFFVPETLRARARVIAAEKGVIAGTQTAAEVFRRIEAPAKVQILRNDGSEINPGDVVMEIRGSAGAILKAERVALNFLQRLSGIATLTRQFVDAAGNSRVKILDTRKTTPGLRELEKAAVRAGGGANHRFGLFDMVLIKDNHLATTSGLAQLADRIGQFRKARPAIRIEVEADNLEQVRAFLDLEGVDVILLDNMTPAQMREAIALRKREVKFEASGGINLRNVRRIAATGVDYISIGALTHSAPAIDLSLEMTHVDG
jgi:nicotinate-nucleotide pyrophosphorylase (carboxylating)